ncbi:site-specific integrase [Arenibaculum sp.]|jgi:integrase|uniref:tyrosine-type recombinase/integrase n=1 Tax=Arenibaculum sp. TaxID=2865862 RepID=UPI002E11E778|nr:site-specific integrase [Arenibaculum sp.]
MATIRRRTLPSGKIVWQCDYRDQNGARRSKQFERKREADAFLVRARSEVAQGIHTADSASSTVAEVGELWIKRCEDDGLEASTVKMYREHLRLHISPLIGAQKLSRLTMPGVEAFKDQLLESRSRDMARRVLTSLKGIIKEARRRGLLAQNPAEGVTVDLRRSEEEEGEIPSKDHIRAMLAKAPEIWPLKKITRGRWVKGEGRPERHLPQPWRPLIVTAIFTGMRASELRGLPWANVDLSAGVIRVRQRADRWQQIGPPKSRAGRRDIPLAPIVVNTLREWKMACPATALDLVFPNELGQALTHTNLSRQGFYPLLKACGLWSKADDAGVYTFHSLRHAAASLFIEQGWSPKKVQTVMGHSSIQVTFDIYGHLFPSQEDDREAMAQLQARLLGAPA